MKVMAVMDKAPFHTAKLVQEKRPGWDAKVAGLYYRLTYCPHLSFIEGVWHGLKRFLVPRRLYETAANLGYIFLSTLHLLGAVEVNY